MCTLFVTSVSPIVIFTILFAKEVTVKSVSDNGTATVYHLTEVEHTKTYFVEGILVHNGGYGKY